MLKFYEPGEVRFSGNPMIITVPKKKFKEFVNNYSYPLEKTVLYSDEMVITLFIDKALDERPKYGTMAYSIEYQNKDSKNNKNIYCVTINYKYLHETYDDSIELKELQQK